MSDFDAALARCGTLDEDVLGRPWPFRGRPMDVRYALYRTLEDAQEVYVRVSAGAHPESCRILALAQHAFGGLRGLLAGLPGALLDKAPSSTSMARAGSIRVQCMSRDSPWSWAGSVWSSPMTALRRSAHHSKRRATLSSGAMLLDSGVLHGAASPGESGG